MPNPTLILPRATSRPLLASFLLGALLLAGWLKVGLLSPRPTPDQTKLQSCITALDQTLSQLRAASLMKASYQEQLQLLAEARNRRQTLCLLARYLDRPLPSLADLPDSLAGLSAQRFVFIQAVTRQQNQLRHYQHGL